MSATVTQQELARRLGVTQMTVSRALTGKGRMSEATRQRVIALAAELGYRPNGMARRVQEGRYRGMALLGSTVRPSYNIMEQELWMAVHDALAVDGWHLTASYMDASKLDQPAEVAGLLDRLLADAVMVHDVGPRSPAAAPVLARHRVPAVWLNSGRESDAADFADAQGAEDATLHLLRAGYRRPVLLLNGDPADPTAHCSTVNRALGYRKACQKASIPPRLVFLPMDAPDRQRAQQFLLARRLVTEGQRPDAVLCYAAMTAYHVRLAAAEQGLRIPDELGLMTFAKPGDAFMDIPISLCELDYSALGREAVRLAMAKIADPTTLLPQSLVPLRIVPRATTRAC
jgi:LacI family transcriptional regulator